MKTRITLITCSVAFAAALAGYFASDGANPVKPVTQHSTNKTTALKAGTISAHGDSAVDLVKAVDGTSAGLADGQQTVYHDPKVAAIMKKHREEFAEYKSSGVRVSNVRENAPNGTILGESSYSRQISKDLMAFGVRKGLTPEQVQQSADILGNGILAWRELITKYGTTPTLESATLQKAQRDKTRADLVTVLGEEKADAIIAYNFSQRYRETTIASLQDACIRSGKPLSVEASDQLSIILFEERFVPGSSATIDPKDAAALSKMDPQIIQRASEVLSPEQTENLSMILASRWNPNGNTRIE